MMKKLIALFMILTLIASFIPSFALADSSFVATLEATKDGVPIRSRAEM